eukprot:TRINITY_DN6049_c0_g1_i2.p1 TRINITY_DN6049_c0_g1~~TRINITY_DN6049_c0_g1_i2.p1  ORF type:complete len:566 (-),score=86.25 TRINITY_DN6049_c0_g1_i2:135-1778(-)
MSYLSDFRHSVGISTTTYKYATITTTFEEDVFFMLPCSGEEQPEFENCSEESCMDEEGVEVDIKAGERISISFTITNPETCTGFSLTPSPDKNSLRLTLTSGEFSQVFSNDDFSPLPLIVCCQDLRTKTSGTWNGTLTVVATSAEAHKFDIHVDMAGRRLPLKGHEPLVPFVVECDNSHLCSTENNCRKFNVDSSTTDPLFHWGWTKQNGLLGTEVTDFFQYPPLPSDNYVNNTITSVIQLSAAHEGEILFDYTIGIGDVIRGDELDASCTIRYIGLVNADGNPVASSPMPLEPYQPECRSAEFRYHEAGFNEVIVALNNGTTKNLAASVALINLGYSFTSSLQWKACREFLKSYVDITETPVQIQTKACLVPFDDPDRRSTDPCCNNDPTMCCMGGLHTQNVTRYEYNKEKSLSAIGTEDNTTCRFPLCVENTLGAYAEYADKQQLCTDDYQAEIKDRDFNYDPWTWCQGLVIPFHKRTCFSSTSCAERYGNTSYCDNSACVIPCSQDSDCYAVGTCNDGFCEYNLHSEKSLILTEFSRVLWFSHF